MRVRIGALVNQERGGCKKMKKKTGVALLLACCLAFGAIGAGAATQLQKITAYFDSSKKVIIDGKKYTNKVMTYKGTVYVPLNSYSKAVGEKISYDSKQKTYYVGKKPTAPTGIIKYSSDFDHTKASKSLKTQATALIKIYGNSLSTGKVSDFNKYVDKHVYEFDKKDYAIGRPYNKDRYKEKIVNTKKANTKENMTAYSKALKNVKQSEIEIKGATKDTSGAKFFYSFQPNGWNALSTVTLTLDFKKLKNGSYVLEHIHFY